MHTMVVARENPNLEAQVLEVTLLTKIDEWGPGVGLPVSDAIRIVLVRHTVLVQIDLCTSLPFLQVALGL